MSRIIILATLLALNAGFVFSQRNNAVDTTTYFSRTKKVNDTCYEVVHYFSYGPILSKESYKDEAHKIAHGTWVYYKKNGYMDSVCYFRENLAHGNWHFTNDTNRIYKEKQYENGKLIAVHDVIKRDSIRRAARDTTKKIDGREPEFVGGRSGWRSYLEKNFRYPERARKSEKEGMVVVQFIVDTLGNVSMIDLFKSVEYSIDEEAKRLIFKSPRWSPAILEGAKVKGYMRQPVIFRLQ